jgi:RNA polymerase sigma-70 factor (ECF subfamily)
MANSARRGASANGVERAGPDDADVVERVLGGDRDAYRVLVSRHQDGLYRHALRMVGSPDVAADLVQATLIKGFSRLRSCRDPAKFKAWAYRILSNGCKDYLKDRRRRNVSLDDPDAAQAAGSVDPSSELERTELLHRIEVALARLPAAQREAFLLKHVEGLSYEEIADRTGGSVPALKMRVHRARELLQDILRESE